MSGNIFEAVYNLIASNEAVADRLDGRVYPHLRPLTDENEKLTVDYPIAVYEKSGAISHKTLWEETNMFTDTFDIVLVDADFKRLTQLAHDLRRELDKHNGPDGGIRFELVRFEDEDSQYFEKVKAYSIIQTYDIFWMYNN